ncbi:recombinase family protein [Epilithonimonas pallida]|uniref:Site-specific DNA recombinase n=1 Tax=Epilithonimonas pallida TaxID=373671 RepID=A0ABY1R5H1_9FLAO|nr:recombinase family protein [Epilithonimonas pallida]SMP95466.1 Site-specific DNA recombinase [Epilithonimonas pallida]
MEYVSYYRVSTQRQGNSGLGLDAQKRTVETFLKNKKPIKEFIDVESGTAKGNNRKGLKDALEYCKQHKVTLILSKLDRLSRSVSFIAQLMDSEVEFVICEFPTANKFTLHIFAALAEQEARYISERTKSALAELKRKGVKLGSPQNLNAEARAKGLEVRQQKARDNENTKKASILISSLRQKGLSFQEIADSLNEYDYKTSSNCKFSKVQVRRIFLKS